MSRTKKKRYPRCSYQCLGEGCGKRSTQGSDVERRQIFCHHCCRTVWAVRVEPYTSTRKFAHRRKR